MTYPLFLDDDRFPPDDGRDWEIARSLDDLRDICRRRGPPNFISFDHDLTLDTPSGHQIAKLMVEADLNGGEADGLHFRFAPDFTYRIHSENPRGGENIAALIERYLRFRAEEQAEL